MLKAFLCLLLGCKTVVKGYTGNTVKAYDALAGQEVNSPMYCLIRLRFCARCGKPNPHYDEKVREA